MILAELSDIKVLSVYRDNLKRLDNAFEYFNNARYQDDAEYKRAEETLRMIIRNLSNLEEEMLKRGVEYEGILCERM